MLLVHSGPNYFLNRIFHAPDALIRKRLPLDVVAIPSSLVMRLFLKTLLSCKIVSDRQNKNSKFRFLEYSELRVQTIFIVDQDDLTHQRAVQTSDYPRGPWETMSRILLYGTNHRRRWRIALKLLQDAAWVGPGWQESCR
jgi:hypothetical protein